MSENRILKQILDSAQEIPAPEQLQPDVIEQRLEQHAQNLKEKEQWKRRVWKKGLACAAAAVICAGLIALGGRNLGVSNSSATGQDDMDVRSFDMSGGESSAAAAAAPETAGTDGGSSAGASGRAESSWTALDFESLFEQAEGYGDIGEYLSGEQTAQADTAAEGAEEDGSYGCGESAAEGTSGEFYMEGSNIYKLDGQTLKRMKLENGVLTDTEELFLGEIRDGEQMLDLYTDGSYLQIIVGTDQNTRLLSYDISDRNRPVMSGEVDQEGGYAGSVKENGYRMLVTGLELDLPDGWESGDRADEKEEAPEWMPRINGQAPAPDNCYFSVQGGNRAWLISYFDTENQAEAVHCGMIIGGSADLYLNGENIFLKEIRYNGTENSTNLAKYEWTGGSLRPAGAVSISGAVEQKSWLDERDGYLRALAVTGDEESQMTGSLYILDSEMNVTGCLEWLNLGEKVSAVWYTDSRAYISASGNGSGLLLTVDFSEPASPLPADEQTTEEAFEFLLPWGDGQMLGISLAEKEGEESLRLALYDCSAETGAPAEQYSRTEEGDFSGCSLLTDSESGTVALIRENAGAPEVVFSLCGLDKT